MRSTWRNSRMEVGKFVLFDRGADQVDSIFLTAERRSTFSDFYRRLVPVPTGFQRNHRAVRNGNRLQVSPRLSRFESSFIQR